MTFRPLMQKTQTGLLLEHFLKASSISAIEAQAMYRIRSLSRRINDLEAAGYRFAREDRRDPTGQRYVRYHFIGKTANRLAA